MTITGRFVPAASLLLLFVASGCGPGNSTSGTVSGKVTYKGQPVTGGSLAFHTKEGAIYPTVINEDGTYTLTGMPTGDMTVTVDTEALNPDKVIPTYGEPGQPGQPGQPGAGGTMQPPPGVAAPPQKETGKYIKIPEKYNDPTKSGLTVNVTSTGTKKDFDLSD